MAVYPFITPMKIVKILNKSVPLRPGEGGMIGDVKSPRSRICKRPDLVRDYQNTRHQII